MIFLKFLPKNNKGVQHFLSNFRNKNNKKHTRGKSSIFFLKFWGKIKYHMGVSPAWITKSCMIFLNFLHKLENIRRGKSSILEKSQGVYPAWFFLKFWQNIEISQGVKSSMILFKFWPKKLKNYKGRVEHNFSQIFGKIEKKITRVS